MTIIRPLRPFGSGLKLTGQEWLTLGRFFFGDSPRFYCSACKGDFTSLVTPTLCPNCRATAENDPHAITMSHGGISGRVFPFAVESL